MSKILLVVDLQKQFKDESGKHYKDCLTYIRKNGRDYDMIIGAIFSICSKGSTTPNTYKFADNLNWTECAMCDGRDLEFNPDVELIHSNYTVDIYDLHIDKEDQIDIIGCDTDACVLSTVFYLFNNNYNFNVLSKYCYSSGGDDLHEKALKIMKRQFGNAIE